MPDIVDHCQAPDTEPSRCSVLSTYNRTQALKEGTLISAGRMASEVGFYRPVALTAAAWSHCVFWNEEDTQRQVGQNETGRLWDVLYMAACAIRRSQGIHNQLLFPLFWVPRDGHSMKATFTTLKIVASLGDDDKTVVTIMLPSER